MVCSQNKKFIIVSGPIASGKTTLSLNLAVNIPGGCFYMDKDSLVPVSNIIAPDRKSKVFKEKVRDPEYDTLEKIALENLMFNDIVLINAPYTSELSEEANGGSKRFSKLRSSVKKSDGELIVIYILTDNETRKLHFEKRAINDPDAGERDKLMAEHYKNGETDDLSVPPINSRSANLDRFIVYDSKEENAFEKLLNTLGLRCVKPFNPDILLNFHS